jgi:hypothetical protein
MFGRVDGITGTLAGEICQEQVDIGLYPGSILIQAQEKVTWTQDF